MTINFAAILRELDPPARLDGELRYRVRPIPGTSHYFGRDSQSRPCLLLELRDHSRRTPIRLALLEVQFAVPCRILDDDGSERIQTLTSIICRTTDNVVTGYFAHVAQTIVTIVGPSPSSNEVAQAVQRLTDLFQSLSRPTGRSVLGLFAELLAIHVSGDPRVALSAWRSTVDDRYDFSIANVRLEVKSTSDRVRSHYFSREQCMPPDGTVAVLLSVFVERSGGGLSIGELVDRIEAQLAEDAELIFRLHATVAATMGNATAEALSMRFDEQLARDSIRLYELAHIPAVRDELPVGVSQVRFRADMSQITPANRHNLDQRDTTVRALLPG